MKKTKIKFLLLLIIGQIISCSKDDEPRFVGLGDFSGTYRVLYVNVPSSCVNRGIYSLNDLEINPNGRFKRKMYSDECIVSEILEGQITITGSFYGGPFGTIEYDNSEIIEDIHIDPSIDGIHNQLHIDLKNSSLQYHYRRTD